MVALEDLVTELINPLSIREIHWRQGGLGTSGRLDGVVQFLERSLDAGDSNDLGPGRAKGNGAGPTDPRLAPVTKGNPGRPTAFLHSSVDQAKS